MKKYIVTETQIKKIVDKLVNEQKEHNVDTMIVQCFLNKVIGAKLVVDGKTGSNSLTEKAIMQYQIKKNIYPVDGVWGGITHSKLTADERKIWKMCQRKHIYLF